MSLSALKAIITTVGTCNAIINEVLSGRVDSELTLSATDSIGDIVEYIWEFGDGTRSSGSSVAHTWTAVGTYDLTLRVTNSKGATSITQTTITIDEALVPITVNHNGPFSAVENVEVSLSATVAGDNIATIECDPGDGSGYLTATGGVLLHTYTTTTGSPFTVTFRVTDTDTNTYTDSTTCTVAAAGTAPTASANGPYTTTVNQPVQLTAAGSFTDGYPGDISVVKWEIAYGAGTETILSAWSPTITPTVVEGPIDVTLTVTNSFSLTDTDTTTLTVSAATGNEILDWFDDAPDVGAYDVEKSIPVGGNALGTRGFPRRSSGVLKSLITVAQAACFDLLNNVVWWYDDLTASAKALNPDMIGGRRIIAQEWLDWTSATPLRGPHIKAYTQGDTVDLTRTGGNVPSAFMLYGPSVTITNSGANNTNAAISFTVSTIDGSVPIAAGETIVVRSGQADWSDAEHMRVSSVSGTTVTIASGNRGFKSTIRAHPSGSVVATHKRGNGGDNIENVVYNLSTACPTVGGMQCWEWLARWFAAWAKYMPNGTLCDPPIEVIIDDSSFLRYPAGGTATPENSGNGKIRNCSVANTGTTDWGMSATGENLWGDGYEAMYDLMESLMTSGGTQIVLCGGDSKFAGDASAGTEMELGLNGGGNDSNVGPPEYDAYFWNAYQNALMHTPHSTGPCVTDLMSKIDPQVYPAAKRFEIAMSCWLHTMYSFVNGNRSFQWANEGAVELDTANHGRCVSSTDPTTIRANVGWLGNPLDRGYRIIQGTGGTAPADSLISNSDFTTTPVGSWTSSNGTLSWDETKGYTTNGKSLRFSPTISSATNVLTGSYIQSPTVNLVAGKDYTLCLVLDCEDFRPVEFNLGSLDTSPTGTEPGIFRPNKWNKVVLSWQQASTQNNVSLRIYVGAFNEDIWIDQVYLFEDVYSGLMRRDFDNGVIIANAGSISRSNIALDGTYQYLTNTGDDHALAGTSVTTVTIPAWDAAILVRESI